MKGKKGTIMLISGELDKAITAFLIATGFAALGMEMRLWFMTWGINSIKRRRRVFSRFRKSDPAREGGYRNLATDNYLQPFMELISHCGPDSLPLSQRHLMGLGSFVFRKLMKKKNVPELIELIEAAEELGVKFYICQICADAFGMRMDDLLVSDAEVKGITSYMQDSLESQVNLII